MDLVCQLCGSTIEVEFEWEDEEESKRLMAEGREGQFGLECPYCSGIILLTIKKGIEENSLNEVRKN